MENKSKSINLPQSKIENDTEMYHSESVYESKQEFTIPLPKYTEMEAQVDPLNYPGSSEVSKNSNQDVTTSAKYLSGISDESADENIKAQIHDKNVASESGEKQSLVFNLKNKAVQDNTEVIRNLKEGVSDIAKAYALQECREKEESQDNHSSQGCNMRKDAEGCSGDQSIENRVDMHTSQIEIVPECIKMMEGCNSCSHVSKVRSNEPTSNSQTQTMNQTSRSTVTDTNTSTHRTCSSQTSTQDQRNRSAQTSTQDQWNRSAQTSHTVPQGLRSSSVQTTCIQVTQECQITPDYTTTSSQTSIPKSNIIRRTVIKPWAARKYQDMCMCAELGAPCTCANRKASSWQMVLPRNSSWWPTVKKTLLIIAALIPWVFLIVYSIYYYRANN